MNVTANKLTCADVSTGDTAIFEVAYGAEEIIEVVEMWVGNPINRDADGEILSPPSASMTSTPWIMLKFGLMGPTWGPRYVLRFTHEPITTVEKR